MPAITNKTKIRGAKKFNRILLAWKLAVLARSRDALLNHERWYEKQSIDPFYRLLRRQPPTWIQCMQFRNLIEIGHNWARLYQDHQLDGRVFLWVFPSNFIESQVVAVRDGMKHFYDHTFEPSPTAHKMDPCFRAIALEHRLEFTSGFECDYLSESEYYADQTPNSQRLIRRDERDGESIYVIKLQRVLIWEVNHAK